MFRPRGGWDWFGVTKPVVCCIGGALENWAFFLNCGRCFSSERSMPSFVKGLGRTSFIPGESQKLLRRGTQVLTISEIHVNIISSNI
jgi:hypothetical protein